MVEIMQLSRIADMLDSSHVIRRFLLFISSLFFTFYSSLEYSYPMNAQTCNFRLWAFGM